MMTKKIKLKIEMNTNQNNTSKCNILQINIGSNTLCLGFFELFNEIFRIRQVLQWFPSCFIVVLPFDKILHPSFPESFLNYFLLFLLSFQLTRNLLFLSVFLLPFLKILNKIL